MAMSNRDRIGQMLEILAPPLDAFITDCLAHGVPDGKDWTVLVAAKDARNGASGKTYSSTDPQVIFRMLTENIPHQVKPGWFPFDKRLSKVHQSYASELRDIRNDWAHNASFSADDAYRALDTAERLLAGVNAPDAAAKVKALRLDLRRVTADQDDRRTLRSTTSSAEATGLRPWRDVLMPHDDVATGNLKAAEFAADLYKVAQGDSDVEADYSDPVQFFARTYLTEGLRDLIDRAVRRLAGDDNASPVINLQTNFGGGKTHSMLSLWHLAAGRSLTDFPQSLQDVLALTPYADLAEQKVWRVAIVGNHLAANGATKPDGTTVHTIWGELAWQLGGVAGYEMVRTADESGTNPGQALHDLLAAYSPAVILIDEWVAYARQLYGRDDLAGGTFDTQFTFAQALTEAAKATSGVLLAISIPASDHDRDGDQLAPGSAEEVGGEYGMEALSRMQNVVRRVADQWRPASANEAYHIVRQRLFRTPDSAALAEISRTAKEFVDLYRREPSNFPREARDQGYEERIKRSYPIHPELFDRLYQEWSTLERFQRTRGVLRLMSTVIHGLWVAGDTGPLILPGSIPLESSSVSSELLQYLPDQWKSIVDSDVDGPQSEPVRIDQSNPLYGQRSITRRLARTVFFGAAPTIGSSLKGIEGQRVFLGTAVPGDVVGNFHSALNLLSDKATYFYAGSGKYWYDTQANINRRAKDQADRLHPEDVWAQVRDRLSGQSKTRGSFARVLVCPGESGDIPDEDEVALVLLPPRVTHRARSKDSSAVELARAMTERHGSGHRSNRNMVVFLAADDARAGELEHAVRTYLGWKDVHDKAGELDLTQSQQQQAREQMHRADQTTSDRLLGAYHWVLRPAQADGGAPFTIEETKVETQGSSLAEKVSRKLGTEGQLQTQTSATNVVLQLRGILRSIWESGHVTVGELWDIYARYPYMPRLRDRAVLDAGLVDGFGTTWQFEGFALADGYDGERYTGLVDPSDSHGAVTDATLLVTMDRARQQWDRERPVSAQDLGADDRGSAPDYDSADRPPVAIAHPAVSKTRFFGVRELDAATYASDLKKIHDEVLVHLSANPDARVRIKVEIEAELDDGFDDGQIRTVQENAQTLKFEQAAFEES